MTLLEIDGLRANYGAETVRCRRRAGTHDRRRCQRESGPCARAGIGPSERYLCTRVYSVRATAEIAPVDLPWTCKLETCRLVGRT